MAIVDRSSGSFEAQIVATQISTWSSRGSRYFRGRGRADKIEALREDLELPGATKTARRPKAPTNVEIRTKKVGG